jgi:PAS domain S-box-containing protein
MQPLLVPDGIEYLILETDLTIASASVGAALFADEPELVVVGKDVRLSFPESIGLEETIAAIVRGDQESFIIKSIARLIAPQTSLYFNLSIKKLQEKIIIYLQDVTELMELKQSLIQRANETEFLLNSLSISQDYLQKILVSMGDALLVTSNSGRIKKVNPAMENLLGYDEAELSDQSLNFLILNGDFSSAQIYQKLFQNNYKIEKLQLNCQHQDGRQLIVEFSCSLVQTEIKSLFDIVYIGRDITERMRMEAEIRQALQKEKELSELKSRFVAMTSHEFRNPLSSILGCVEILSDPNLASIEEQPSYLSYIKQSALNMQSLLEDILILGRAEAGKLKFQPGNIEIQTFCQELIQELQMTTRKERIELEFQQHSPMICADRKLLRQILNNLLSNALKYSPSEQPITLQVTEKDQEIIFRVSDRGIGIPREDCQHLFESFHRAKNVGNIAGTGLGLSIVKKSVELHGGSIEVDSEINQGTTITVRLPCLSSIVNQSTKV